MHFREHWKPRYGRSTITFKAVKSHRTLNMQCSLTGFTSLFTFESPWVSENGGPTSKYGDPIYFTRIFNRFIQAMVFIMFNLSENTSLLTCSPKMKNISGSIICISKCISMCIWFINFIPLMYFNRMLLHFRLSYVLLTCTLWYQVI